MQRPAWIRTAILARLLSLAPLEEQSVSLRRQPRRRRTRPMQRIRRVEANRRPTAHPGPAVTSAVPTLLPAAPVSRGKAVDLDGEHQVLVGQVEPGDEERPVVHLELRSEG